MVACNIGRRCSIVVMIACGIGRRCSIVVMVACDIGRRCFMSVKCNGSTESLSIGCDRSTLSDDGRSFLQQRSKRGVEVQRLPPGSAGHSLLDPLHSLYHKYPIRADCIAYGLIDVTCVCISLLFYIPLPKQRGLLQVYPRPASGYPPTQPQSHDRNDTGSPMARPVEQLS